MTRPRTLLSWSTGKDSAWTLHVLRTAGEVEVVGLLTTVNEAFDRVAMHSVRRSLLEAQAAAVGLPLVTVPVPWPGSNEAYEAAGRRALAAAREGMGVTHVAFGDLFLEDVRAYRERQLRDTPLEPLFPLWGRPTGELAREMVAGGLRAVLTCIDPRRLARSFAGRDFDTRLLAELPADVDPCGEAGEFHTFASDGPMFGTPLRPAVGAIVERDGFVFADLVDADARAPSAPDAGAPFEGAVFDADGALSREFLLHRGDCCRNGCRNCPYGFRALEERPATR